MAARTIGKSGCAIPTVTQLCLPARTGRRMETGNHNAYHQRAMIRVVLPYHLRNLARVSSDVELDVASPVTVSAVLDALEAKYPVLRGTVRDHGTLKRRPFIRFFACKEDLSLEAPDTELPDEVVSGKEPFLIVGAMAGG
jgi:molybdopterin synthase sulfur carrier subunit